MYFVPHDGWSMRIVAVSRIAWYLQGLAQLSHVQMLRRYREHRRPLNYL
jgi:hypothetical protein